MQRLADHAKILANSSAEYGGRWKNQYILDFERERAIDLMFVAFIPLIVLWLVYRAVLYVCIGAKAFNNTQK
jgi:hypothetical protein